MTARSASPLALADKEDGMCTTFRRVSRVAVTMFTAAAVLALVPSLAGAQVCMLDRQQPVYDYGYWFEQSVERWQTFTAGTQSLCRIGVVVRRIGNPGNIHMEVRDAGGVLIWESLVAEWRTPVGEASLHTIDISPPVELVPGETYKLLLRSDAPSADPSNRYFWMGESVSAFDGQADVWETRPQFAYAFETFGQRLERCSAAAGSFSPAGAMSGPRAWHSGTTLDDGRVLIAGGGPSGEEGASAEIYDPASGRFLPTESMKFGRSSHGAVRLNDVPHEIIEV